VKIDLSGQDLQRRYSDLGARDDALLDSEGSFRQLLEDAHDCIVAIDLEGRITYCNPAVQAMSGGRDLIGLPIRKLVAPESLSVYDTMIDRRRAGVTDHLSYAFTLRDSMGAERHFDARSSILSKDGVPVGIMVIAREETERKKTEAVLVESEAKYRSLVENANEAIFIVQDGVLKFANPRTLVLTGATAEELAVTPFTEFIHPEDREFVLKSHLRRLRGERFAPRYRFRAVRKAGETRWVELDAVRIQWQGRDATLNFVADVTERVAMEEALKESEARYRSFFMTSRDAVYITTREGELLDCNDAAAEMFGYGDKETLLRMFRISDIYAVSEERARHIEAIERQGSVMDYPITLRGLDGRIHHTLISSTLWRDPLGRVGFQGTIKDITERKEAEEHLQKTLWNLRKAVEAIITTLSMAVEMKDPYTAGHQRRVSQLCRAIAEAMGLLPDQVEGVAMAAMIHDIGKIGLPAEILSKPTRLTPIELSLLQTHADTGYDILKDIEFPWPVAHIVAQHHERMDGSGYPEGLAMDDILLEAKILAVADVVEAMASYRPYRPAVGIVSALEEIERQQGILYDPEVVQVCLRLFREQGYRLE